MAGSELIHLNVGGRSVSRKKLDNQNPVVLDPNPPTDLI